MARSVQIVFSRPFPGKDDEYNEWYDNVHIPDVLKVPGVVSAQRYDLRPLARDEGEPEFRYVTVYEIDGDPDQVMADFGAGVAAGKMPLSPAFDVAATKLAFWTEHGGKRVRE